MLKQKSVNSSERPYDALPAVLKEHLDKSGKSIYQLGSDSRVDSMRVAQMALDSEALVQFLETPDWII